ncbi:MAG TPA: c-type cytochrome [Burkholderiaceae bacterium]|nr:c-type cytochrome [Burkholderiaceae bacterium]
MPRSFRWCANLRRLLPRALLGALLVASFEAGAQAPTAAIERGRYLVESILGCGNCHTPKAPTGEPIASRNLSGGGLTFSIPPFSGVASNITPDRETGIGSWTADEIKRAIVEGKRPNHGRLANTELAVLMATPFFKALTPSDLDAVVSYLRSVPAVRNEVAAPVYRMAQTHQPFPPAEAGFTDAKMSDPVYRGRYLATIAHCLECHSPQEKGVLDYGRLGAGGRTFDAQLVQGFPASWPGARAANITSHRTAGIGAWTDDQIKRAISQGISRDGRRLQPPMPFAYYANLSPSDLSAIVAYLRTLPPLE